MHKYMKLCVIFVVLFVLCACQISRIIEVSPTASMVIMPTVSADVFVEKIEFETRKIQMPEQTEGELLAFQIIKRVYEDEYTVADYAWGFYDMEGNVVLEAQYDNAGNFYNGYAYFCNAPEKGEEEYDAGYVNAKGEAVFFRQKADEVALSLTEENGKLYQEFIKVKTPGAKFDFSDEWDGCSDYYLINYQSEKLIVNKSGDILLRNWRRVYDAGNNCIVVSIELCQNILLDLSTGGKTELELRNLELVNVSPSEKLILVFDPDSCSYGYVDYAGNMVIPTIYEDAGAFSCGLAPVYDEFGWSYIDSKGNKAFAQSYSWAFEFSQDLALVSDETVEEFYLIDKKGNMIGTRGYDYSDLTYDILPPTVFPYVDFYFSGNYMSVPIPKSQQIAFIDRTGREIFRYQIYTGEVEKK